MSAPLPDQHTQSTAAQMPLLPGTPPALHGDNEAAQSSQIDNLPLGYLNSHPPTDSNRSGLCSFSPSLDRKDGSVRFRTRPTPLLPDSWQAKPGPVSGNRRVSLGLATSVGGNF